MVCRSSRVFCRIRQSDLEPHSVAYVEVGANTDIVVNTTNAAETVSASDLHAANMEIVLQGVHLGLTPPTSITRDLP